MSGFDENVSIYLRNHPTCLSHYLPLVLLAYLKAMGWYCYGGRAFFYNKKSSIRYLFCINRCGKKLQHFNTCKEYPDYWMIDFLYYLLLIRAYVVLNSTSFYGGRGVKSELVWYIIVCCLLVHLILWLYVYLLMILYLNLHWMHYHYFYWRYFTIYTVYTYMEIMVTS